MLAKLSIDQTLVKAKSHIKKNEIAEAQNLYKEILRLFPKNIRAQKGLAALQNHTLVNSIQTSPSFLLNKLVMLYNQGNFTTVVEQAQFLTKQYPGAFIIWNILGAAHKNLGQIELASEAFKKVTELNPNFADGFNNLGISLKDQEKIDKALEAFKKALLIKPDYAEVYNNIGNAFKYQNKFKEAIEAYEKAISLKPDYADAYNNMGVALKDKGSFKEAIKAYNKALSIKPDYAEAHCNKGITLQKLGEFEEAKLSLGTAISIKPNNSENYFNIGIILQDQDKQDEAIVSYKNAILYDPNHAESYYNMGDCLKKQGNLSDAIVAYNNALSIKPNFFEAYNNLGVALQEQGDFNKAIDQYNKALLHNPKYVEAYNNIGNAFKYQNKFKEAIEAYEKAISLKPDYADAYNNMSNTLRFQSKFKESIKVCKKALSIKPDHADAHLNLSFALLNAGKIKEGLDEYEWRFKTNKFKSYERHFSKPLWDGKKNLKGKKILVWCEQGIGDTINWSSCLPFISSQAKHCILECQQKLVPLLRRSFPNVEVKPENRDLDLDRDDFDYHLPMGSLYRYFIHEIEANAKILSHLVPDPLRVEYWRERLVSLGKGPYIGISWKSSDTSGNRINNYPHLSEWSPIFNIPNVTFINLQYSDYSNDLIKIKDEFGVTVHNFNDLDHFNNIDDVAALCSALDMVVSIQNSVPLISSAVGKPTKVATWKQSSSNNILLNPLSTTADMYERNTEDSWNYIFNKIAKNIINHEFKSI